MTITTRAVRLADIRTGRADVVDAADPRDVLGRVTRAEFTRAAEVGGGTVTTTAWEARLDLSPHQAADALCPTREAAVAWIAANAPAGFDESAVSIRPRCGMW